MTALYWQTGLLLAGAYLLGALVSCLVRKMKGAGRHVADGTGPVAAGVTGGTIATSDVTPAPDVPYRQASDSQVVEPALQPVQVEPAQVEPVQVEPVQVEPVQVEPVQVEPVQVSDAQISRPERSLATEISSGEATQRFERSLSGPVAEPVAPATPDTSTTTVAAAAAATAAAAVALGRGATSDAVPESIETTADSAATAIETTPADVDLSVPGVAETVAQASGETGAWQATGIETQLAEAAEATPLEGLDLATVPAPAQAVAESVETVSATTAAATVDVALPSVEAAPVDVDLTTPAPAEAVAETTAPASVEPGTWQTTGIELQQVQAAEAAALEGIDLTTAPAAPAPVETVPVETAPVEAGAERTASVSAATAAAAAAVAVAGASAARSLGGTDPSGQISEEAAVQSDAALEFDPDQIAVPGQAPVEAPAMPDLAVAGTAAATAAVAGSAAVGQAADAGVSDDLQQIRNIDDDLHRQLNGAGITRYRQISKWTAADVDRWNGELGLSGRIEKENWIEQAQVLAAGGQTVYALRRAGGQIAGAALASEAPTVAAPAAEFAALQPEAAPATTGYTVAGAVAAAGTLGSAALAGSAIPPATGQTFEASSAEAAVATTQGAVDPAPAVADDLQNIASIGPELAEQLNGLGIASYAHIAQMTPEDVSRLDGGLGLAGRIGQENWIGQAQLLAAGGQTDYAQRRAMSPAEVPEQAPSAQAPPAQVVPAQSTATEPPASGSLAGLAAAGAADAATVASGLGSGAGEILQEAAEATGIDADPTALGAATWGTETGADAAAVAAGAAAIGAGAVAPALTPSAPGLQPADLGDAVSANAPASPPAATDAVTRGNLTGMRSVRSEAYRTDGAAAPGGGARVLSSEPDDLKRIRGVGVLIEKKLNSLGVTNYQQIANWSHDDVASVSQALDFKGRIERENWIEQARILSAGGYTEFSSRVDRGEV